ncbi:hypothetical protein C7H19_18435 [Aphanothece hegewaldii CCALA 016]|uniref:Uncharacterized protein n=1 Tax=Aphanothece hegewaldii CCALA 016 TaxID=2107694 RepID=A0A2T1LTU6_9CHRO|nr:hypothetical protein [Aphanothece hegewaldii]PSF34545.1 hypothetical protein C7H19_18435 [Aphanothece hegewaldii CCALA 016]
MKKWLKSIRISRIVLTFILFFTLLLNNFGFSEKVLAETINPEKAAQKVEKAAEKIDQDNQKDTTKDTYGQYEESNEMIDKAREKAKEKLESMANTVKESPKPQEALPPSQNNFIKKVGQF